MEPNIVSAFNAKTHLSELLRETERGSTFVIERRGKPVARLSPPAKLEESKRNLKEIFNDMRELREQIQRRIKGTVNVRELIEEGRRF